MATESVKIEKSVLDKVREVVKITKQSMGGFIELAIEVKLKEIENPKDL